VLEKLPDARLAVIGNGPLLGELHAQADPRVTFLPFAPPMEGWLSGLDCFVLSSDYEAFPVAIVEALACGTPQVATDVGGAREAVTADTGVLVPRGDPVALAEAIVEVLANPGGRGAASRARHATLFGLDRMVAGTAQVYAGALRA
jgi:glycosyltransferase involved in cell wall biosynthesis